MSLLALPEPDKAVLARREELVSHLMRLLPCGVVIADADGRRAFEMDALTAYRCPPLAVVLPGSTAEVSAVLKLCHEEGVKVVARGAGTSLAGGALPAEDAIVLGLSRMNKILALDDTGGVARVQAGVTNLAISEAAAPSGLFYAPDPSSQLACTIGGNIATNAGGAHCLKYGVTTNHILGVTLVRMDGEIVEIGGDYLDTPGYDLLGLVVGSEGQLGIVTEVTVRLLRRPEGMRPMLLGFASSEAAGACVAAIIAGGIVPQAIEYMDRHAIEVCENYAHAGYPLDVEALLIVEVDGSEEEIDLALERIAEIAEDFAPLVSHISQSDEESAAIWKGRKAAFGAIGQISDYYCMDGVIPLSVLPKALLQIRLIGKRHRFEIANIFHAGDGNLHPLILYNASDPRELARAEACGADILKLCVKLGGCLTGEHGVGLEKRDLMTVQFTPVDLALQMRIKTAFDPNWLLNPDKVFPREGRPSR
jgi:glycolate oxidase